MFKSRLDRLMLDWKDTHGKRLTMRELSAETGIAIGTLSRYHSGQVDRLYPDTVVKLCKFFRVGLCDLIELGDIPDDADLTHETPAT